METHNQETQNMPAVKKASAGISSLSLPAAIIIAGIIIAIAVLFSGAKTVGKIAPGGKLTVKEYAPSMQITPVSKDDHIRGDLRKAKVAVIEFSDLQCPYCKQIHPTLAQMVDVYGDEVVWVYRHFPLESIHPAARPAAHASECVAELGGNESFWKFVDGIFSHTGEDDPLTAENMTKLAGIAGVNTDAFNACQQSGKYDSKISDQISQANLAGAEGTPDLTIVDLRTKEAVKAGADPRILVQVLEQMTK